MKYLLLILSLTGGLLSSNSYAYDFSLPQVTVGTINHDATVDSNGYFNTTWYGVPYICFNCTFNSDGKTASGTWYINDGSYDVPFPNKKPDIKPDTPKPSPDTPDTKPDTSDSGSSGGHDSGDSDKPDSGGDTGGGDSTLPTEPDNPGVTPPEKPPVQVPDNAGAYQLLDQFDSCSRNLSSFPSNSGEIEPAYNAVAHQCNAILDRLRSLLVPGEMNSPSDDNHKFLTKNADGSLFSCKRALKSDYDSGYPSYLIPDVTGTRLVGKPYRDGHLGFTFGSDYSDGGYCNSVYKDYVNSHHEPVPDTSGNTGSGSAPNFSCPSGWVQDGNFCRQGSEFFCLTGDYDFASHSCISSSGSGGSSDSSGGGTTDSCPSGSHHVPGTPACTTDLNPGGGGGSGSGSGSTDSNDNGDVVAAINAFHADNNKNHQELMDDLNKKPADPDYTGMEGEFSSMVGGAMSGITDSVKSAWDAGKAAFSEGLSGIDSMLPDIKTSFDLPPGFEAASLGRCIPVVLDFDIKLVGIPDYHFHAVGTQVCLLYDKYIRPVLNFTLVILSFFVIHRLLIRSAEFLTDGRH
ncbi:hypothetical protein ACSAK4_000911 [Salmonella enterica subsp. enterica serovar Newport]